MSDCALCSKTFARVPYLKTHYLLAHPDYRRFGCTECSKTFARALYLKTHYLLAHPDYRQFGCTECSTVCKSAGQLKLHKLWHSDYRQFECTVCSRMFKIAGSLKAHLTVHSDERRFECAVCNKTFKRADYLKLHNLVHSDDRQFECAVCSKAFKQSGNLQRHNEEVHDIGRHRCDYCLGNRNSRNALHDGALDATVHVCRDCFRKATGYGSRSEKRWAEYADEHLGTEGLMATDEALSSLGGCTKRRPDRLYGGPDLVELHEHDGRQHGSYTREEKRITEIYDEPAISGKVMVVFRFNPDGYKTAEVKLTVAERLAVYVALVKRVRAETRTAATPRIFVYYLFYSHANPLIVQHIAHAFVGSMADAQ
jgi:hypothetical protein